MGASLLKTKLYIPLPGKYLVGRVHLIDKLNQCFEPGCCLTLVSAPAGFGKTTLISAWLAAAKNAVPERAAAWLSIDEGDNDPVIFWSYFIAALQTQWEGVGQQALNMLAAQDQGADLEGKLTSLINDLAQVAQLCLIVLDDYHLIRSPQIHQSLAFFIEHAPPHIRLLLASRTDPPLPLALLRGRGQLLEIRLNDLRFSDEDAAAYLNAGIGLNLAEQSVQTLNQKAEGWIAGLQMAAISLRDAAFTQKPERMLDFIASFSGSNRFILDYLIEEVLNRQPEPIQRFLTQTSILDRLCGPLCDALLQDSGPAAQAALQYLESCNLFLFPLDQQRYWYRYHQLFADLLRKRLAQSAPEVVQQLHRRAIDWYEQNDLIPSAIQHAFQLHDLPKAAALVAQVTEAMWGRGEHTTLLAWMNALPDAEKKLYPHLLVFQVSMLISAGKLPEAQACIPLLESYIQASLAQPGQPSGGAEAGAEQIALIGNISALRTYIASFDEDRPALFSHAQTALQNLTRDQDAGQRCGVCLVLANAYLSEGNLEAAERAFVDAIADGKKARKPQLVLTGLSNLTLVLWLQGDLTRAAQICQEGLAPIQQYALERSPMAADICLVWGEVLRERGAWAEAEASIQRGLALAEEQHFLWQTAWGYQARARLLCAQRELAQAESAAQAAVQWADTHGIPAFIASEAAALLAEVWLRQGKTTQVERYLQTRQIQADGEIAFPLQSSFLALARLKWMQADEETAAELLDRIAQWAEAQRQTRALLAALLLRALLQPSGAKAQPGLSFLEQALQLAEAHGYSQAFVAEGEPMRVLLQAALKQAHHPEYAGRLLALFPDLEAETQGAGLSPLDSRPAQPPAGATIPLAEPLSRRELETLRFMAEGLSNKEIAQKLFISLRTVKYYSTGLYNKLGVDSRMQAVTRARELGII